VFAATYVPADHVKTVGEKILSSNNLPAVEFKVTDTTVSNADIASTGVLFVSKELLEYTGSDTEVASIIADEFGAIINASASKNSAFSNAISTIAAKADSEQTQNALLLAKQLSINNMSTKQSMNADATAVDLMVKAGYNPLSLIVVLGKMDGSLTETLTGKPANFKRTMAIYDYISYNYPSQLKIGYNCREYRNFTEYIQPTITKRESSKKELAKFKKQQEKFKKQREKDLRTYKATGGTTGWDASYSILKTLMNSTEK
jgi:predicted Zn-dependent protease